MGLQKTLMFFLLGHCLPAFKRCDVEGNKTMYSLAFDRFNNSDVAVFRPNVGVG